MKHKHRNQTKRLTVCAMLSAMGVVLLSIGSLIEAIDLTAAVLASLLIIYAVIELRGAYAWMTWGVTALLGLLLLPYPKTPALFYLFIGLYPILKEQLEKLGRIPCFLLKLVTFHVMVALLLGIIRLFFPSDLPTLNYMLLITYLLALLTFVLYDFALTRFITFYLVRLRDRLGLK